MLETRHWLCLQRQQAVFFCAQMSLHVDLIFQAAITTARCGRQGRSIVFLMLKEKDYVEFMRLRKVPLQKRKSSENSSDVIPIIRSVAMEDRAVWEKGKTAFVSFIRAYKKLNQIKSVFIWRELEVGKLAMGYGLLHLPSISEVKQHRLYSDGTNLGRNKDSKTYKKGKRNGKKKKREGKARKARKMLLLLMIPTKKLTGKQRQTVQTAEDED
ncbi:unnamed protein product [Brassica rapa]|uniref:ATP-dependent rRNA helicase SPB4-like C-terminal extension domain-containing protein n=1 Tax=Brassica campestris TaxID=3711 RepID=A0A8D9H709_BRACM|nr:unnamed protein product [Brassica rapa]